MRFMILTKAARTTEPGSAQDERLSTALANYHDELVRAGVLLDASGVQPSSNGARIRFAGGTRTLIHGPFDGADEVITGYWMIQVRSREEAIEWARRCPNPYGEGREGEIELRQLFELEGFSPTGTIHRMREVGFAAK